MSEATIMKSENIWNSLLKLKSLPFGGAHCIFDPLKDKEIIEIINQVSNNGCLNSTEIQNQYLSRYRSWINSTTLNQIIGLEKFQISSFSNGTTETFDKFYLKYKNKRLRCFKGEYMYHLASANAYFDKFSYIEDDILDKDDVVVFSLPFSDTGNEPYRMTEILSICDSLGIPVLIDCCYFGNCADINFDFSYRCIECITFSLSKTFPVQHLRIGIRFTKEDDDDPLNVINKNQYINRLAAAVGLEIMNRYHPDYNHTTYRQIQEDFCKTLDIKISKSVFFGIAENSFHEYNRGSLTNRLCLSKYLNSRTLPAEYY